MTAELIQQLSASLRGVCRGVHAEECAEEGGVGGLNPGSRTVFKEEPVGEEEGQHGGGGGKRLCLRQNIQMTQMKKLMMEPRITG